MGEQTKGMSRRAFFGAAAVTGAAAALGLAGCAPSGQASGQESAKGAAKSSALTDDWLGSAPSISDADCKSTEDFELVVVGGGHSGYFTAATAAEEGLKTLLIEKGSDGFGIRSSAIGAVNSTAQQAAGSHIDKNDIVNDLWRTSNGHGRMDIYNRWAENSAETVDWYIDKITANTECRINVEYNMPTEATRYGMWPTGHGTKSDTLKDSKDREKAVREYFDSFINAQPGCESRKQCSMVCLIRENDRVVGLYATDKDGNKLRINASKGVVIATGGYAGNEEMFTAINPDLKKSLSGIMNYPNDTGDGIKACMWAGAAFDPVHTSLVFDRGVIAPDQELGDPYNTTTTYMNLMSQPWLKVNSEGNRFINESTPYDYVIHSAAMYGNRAWYPVWDANWMEDVKRFHTIGCSTVEKREGGNHAASLEATAKKVEDSVAAGVVVKADTLEELADKLGVNKKNFLATVARHNELFEKGSDDDFGKEPFRMSGMTTPPYYGAKVGGLLLCTFDGIRVNIESQAMTENNEPIEGLYVIGNDAGSIYAVSYDNYAAGMHSGHAATAGRMLAKKLAKA